MAVPKTLEEVQGEQDSGIDTGQVQDPEGGTEKLKTAMKTIIKSSAFDRAMKVEAEPSAWTYHKADRQYQVI